MNFDDIKKIDNRIKIKRKTTNYDTNRKTKKKKELKKKN